MPSCVLVLRAALIAAVAACGCSSLEPRNTTPYRAVPVDPVADTEATLAEVAREARAWEGPLFDHVVFREMDGSLSPKRARNAWLDVRYNREVKLVVDGWGRALRLRKPGLVHERGFDLYSIGPDGVDDRGGGDDILASQPPPR